MRLLQNMSYNLTYTSLRGMTVVAREEVIEKDDVLVPQGIEARARRAVTAK